MFRLRELREEKGVKQTTIARYLGVSRQTYAKYERHPEKLSVDQAVVLCDLLDCDFDDFVEENGK